MGWQDDEVLTANWQDDQVVGGDSPISYGSMMKDSLINVAKNTAQNGVMSGLVSAGSEGLNNAGKLLERGGYQAGGMVTDALSPYVPAEVAGGAGYVTNVGVQAIPTLLGTSAAKATVQPSMEWMGKRLLQSALKPDKASILSGDAKKMVNELVKRKINVTEGGLQKVKAIGDDLENSIQKALNDLPESTIITKKGAIDELRKQIADARLQATPSDDISTIMKAWDDFNASHPNLIPVKEANKIKRGTYKALGDKSFVDVSSTSKEAQKSIARGLKNDIEEVAPEVKGLNDELGGILALKKQMKYRVPMSQNRNVGGLAPLAGSLKTAALMAADSSPWIKSILGQTMYHSGAPIATGIGATGGGILGFNRR